MDLRGVLGAGGVGGLFAAVVDVLVTGGDVAFWLLEFGLSQGPLLYVLLARLATLAPEVAWLPAGRIQSALYVVAAVVAAVSLYRLARNLGRSWKQRNES